MRLANVGDGGWMQQDGSGLKPERCVIAAQGTLLGIETAEAAGCWPIDRTNEGKLNHGRRVAALAALVNRRFRGRRGDNSAAFLLFILSLGYLPALSSFGP